MKKTAFLSLVICAFLASDVLAYGVSHHGGIILNCEPPLFFDETPPRNSRVERFQDFAVTASDNTEATSIKVWVNNQPVAVKITEERSGRLRIEGHLEQPITEGKAWMRVTADSKDGCDQLFVWTVYLP